MFSEQRDKRLLYEEIIRKCCKIINLEKLFSLKWMLINVEFNYSKFCYIIC